MIIPSRSSFFYFQFSKPRNPQSGKELGATLVETALLLPLFLCIMFILLWLAYMGNSKYALLSATQRASELGLTRGGLDEWGQPLMMPADAPSATDEIIPWVQEWKTTGTVRTELGQLLVSDFPTHGVERYNRPGEYEWAGESSPLLKDANPVYIYTLIYINQMMRLSVGKSVRFPCIPGGTPPEDGEGCLACAFASPVPDGTLVQFLKVVCVFEPHTYFLQPLIGMFRVMGAWDSSNPSPFLFQAEGISSLTR